MTEFDAWLETAEQSIQKSFPTFFIGSMDHDALESNFNNGVSPVFFASQIVAAKKTMESEEGIKPHILVGWASFGSFLYFLQRTVKDWTSDLVQFSTYLAAFFAAGLLITCVLSARRCYFSESILARRHGLLVLSIVSMVVLTEAASIVEVKASRSQFENIATTSNNGSNPVFQQWKINNRKGK